VAYPEYDVHPYTDATERGAGGAYNDWACVVAMRACGSSRSMLGNGRTEGANQPRRVDEATRDALALKRYSARTRLRTSAGCRGTFGFGRVEWNWMTSKCCVSS
jgi:hypothetical protein